MIRVIRPISSLLTGVAFLLSGAGLLGTLLAVRAVHEGFPESVIGLVMSGYFVGYLLGTWLAPHVIRRVGHIRAFAIFASLASSTALFHALHVEPWTWGLLRMATGSCLVSLYMIVESWLNAQAPSGQRGQVFAIYMAVNFLALALGQWLLLLYPTDGFADFVIVALLLGWSLIPISLTHIRPPSVETMQRLPLRHLYHTSPAGMAGAFGSGFAMGAFWGLGPVAAHRMGLEAAQVSGFMTAAILGGAAIQWPVGRWSDRQDRRLVLASVCAAAAVSALAAYAVRSEPALLLICMFVFGGLAFTVYPVSIALANDLLKPEEMVAGAGTLLLVHGTGAALGPVVAGQTMALTNGGGLLLHFAAVLFLLALYVGWRSLRAGPALANTQFTPMVRTTPAVLELLPEAATSPSENKP